MGELLIELDDRRRASLAKINPEHRHYLVEKTSSGAIILTPATVMSDLEARILRNEDLMAQIRADVEDPSRGVPRPRRRG